MDFAIVQIGGKQFKITPTSVIDVEKLDTEVGKTVVFDKILMVVDGDKVEVGTPYLENTTFEAEVTKSLRGKKIRILRYHHKTRTRKQHGFRQELVTLDFNSSAKQKKIETKVEKPAKETKTARKAVTKKN